MKKLLFGLVVLLGIGMAGKAEAAGATRGAKASQAITYTTTASSVTVNSPGVVYSVVLSTAVAGGEYLALFDAANIGGLTAATLSSALKTRVFYSSATQNTVVNFDPPLQFNSGIIAIPSAITGQALVIYEKGRVVTGY